MTERLSRSFYTLSKFNENVILAFVAQIPGLLLVYQISDYSPKCAPLINKNLLFPTNYNTIINNKHTVITRK